MNCAYTIAVGDPLWGQKALNWCLSVKHQYPKAKTALIYQRSAIEGIEAYIEAFFDYKHELPESEIKNPAEYAFKLKTEMYGIITSTVDAEAYLFMDADTVMLSGRSVDEFFTELKDVEFTAWCNDVYDFATKTRMRDDYTFWCDPEDVAVKYEGLPYELEKMPQINSSFIYFKKGAKASVLFAHTQNVYDDAKAGLLHKKYKGAIPDELCFNIACAITGTLPHQIPYYPIFFTFSAAHFEEQYIRNWKAIGFAGDTRQQDGVVHLYNHCVEYYRDLFDVPQIYKPKAKTAKDVAVLHIPLKGKRTIFRRDEVPNSSGGIFNPDGVYVPGYGYVTIFRKERNDDFYKAGHSQATAIPHIYIRTDEGVELSFELEYANKDKDHRFEDFRIVEGSVVDGQFLVSHTVITKNLTSKMVAGIGLSNVSLRDQTLSFKAVASLPLETERIEKNWVFYRDGDKRLNCVYSLFPYKSFRLAFDVAIASSWIETSNNQIDWDWFHKGKRICNSTKPVLIGDEYVMLFHTKENGIYFHGAAIIDKETKEITHYTKRAIHFPFNGEGWQKGLLYVSGAMYIQNEDTLRVFCGEGDSHSISFDFDATEFLRLVKKDSETPLQTEDEISATTLTDRIYPLVIETVRSGWMIEEKCEWFEKIYSEFAKKKGREFVAVELGVFYGMSAIAQGLIIKELGLPCKLYAIDAWSVEASAEGSNSEENKKWWTEDVNYEHAYASFIHYINYFGLKDIVIPIRGKSDEVVSLVPDEVDILHQDSNHCAEVILRELELYAPKMLDGSIWMADDAKWKESVEGYAKLPEFGFDLIKEVDVNGQSFNVYKKQKETSDASRQLQREADQH